MRECLRYPLPLQAPPPSPSTSIIHCPFLYVLLILNSAPSQPGTDVFEFTLAFMCTSFHTVLCRVGDQKAIAHVRTGRSQLSTKEQSVVNVWLWLDGGTSRQLLFVCVCDLVIPWGFALCHAIPRKIRMWNRAFCGRWQDQRRQRWKKAVERILHSPPLFLLSPGAHYSAHLSCQSSPLGLAHASGWPKIVLSWGLWGPSFWPCVGNNATPLQLWWAQAWPAVNEGGFGVTSLSELWLLAQLCLPRCLLVCVGQEPALVPDGFPKPQGREVKCEAHFILHGVPCSCCRGAAQVDIPLLVWTGAPPSAVPAALFAF